MQVRWKRTKLRKNHRFSYAPNFFPSRVLNFLNTSLGIWLMSSIFISFGTWTYAQWTDSRKLNAERTARVFRIDTEIRERLKAIIGSMESGKYSDKTSPLSKEDLSLIYNVEAGPVSDVDSLYPEFQKRGLRSLILELKSLLPKDEALCMKYVLEEISELRNGSYPDVKVVTQHFEGIAHHRWSAIAEIDRLGDELAPEPVDLKLKTERNKRIQCGHYSYVVGIYEE